MRKLPPLGSLRAFEAVARQLSFRQAAAELGVTPTAISHQIRILEETCGKPLFRRRPRPLALTEAGERLFPVIRQGFDAFSAAIASASARGEVNPLRVTSTNAFVGRWLVPRLPDWRERHPKIPLEIIGTDTVVNLRAGGADFAIRYARTNPPGLASREIFRDNFFPVCSPALLAKVAQPIARAADLMQYPLIHFDWQNWDREAPTWARWFAAAQSVDPGIALASKPWDLSFREELHAIDAVAAGHGIGLCSDVLVSRELKAGTLVKAHTLSLPGYGFYLVHLPSHPRHRNIGAFSAWMRDVA
jgi:LysR family transcriptional regulator, glycine cleavage system transcriptional activator